MWSNLTKEKSLHLWNIRKERIVEDIFLEIDIRSRGYSHCYHLHDTNTAARLVAL
jgi:hypothetical protein